MRGDCAPSRNALPHFVPWEKADIISNRNKISIYQIIPLERGIKFYGQDNRNKRRHMLHVHLDLPDENPCSRRQGN